MVFKKASLIPFNLKFHKASTNNSQCFCNAEVGSLVYFVFPFLLLDFKTTSGLSF